MLIHKIRVPIGSAEKETKVAIKSHDTGHRLQVFFEKTVILTPKRTVFEPIKVPEGSTVVLKIIKPDDTYVLSEGRHTDTYATFDCPPESFTVLGKASAEIYIYAKDGRRITSDTFYIDIQKKADAGSGQQSEPYVDVMAEQIKAACDAAERAEAAAKSAEEAAERLGDMPVYDGAFVLTPSGDNDITLKTSQTIMPADIVIEKVPYSEVTNTSNGTTVMIL